MPGEGFDVKSCTSVETSLKEGEYVRMDDRRVEEMECK